MPFPFVILIYIAIFGVALYAINKFLPMQPPFKELFNIVCIILVLVWLLYLIPGLPGPASWRCP